MVMLPPEPAGAPYISFMLLVPLIGAFVVYAAGGSTKTARIMALAISLVPLAISIFIYLESSSLPKINTYIYYEEYPWIPQIGASYSVGVDGLSIPLVFLTALLTTLSIIFSWNQKHRAKEFFAILLLMDVAITGVFVSLNFFLFFVFWEVQLIPMYFLIAVWGGERKRYAAIKFFLYTQAASILVLFGVVALYLQCYGLFATPHYTFSMIEIAEVAPNLPLQIQATLFLLLFIGFGVKLPMFPFHTWLPDAHVEAPTAGSVLLAGVLLKMGGYGLIRVGYMMLPDGANYASLLVAVMGVASMVIGAVLCCPQKDLKSMVAYSSISHMGFVLFGMSTGNIMGVSGAIFQMVTHGLISPALFMLAGAVGHNAGTRMIHELGGIASKMPVAAAFLVATFFASLGLPGMCGFVSEFLVFVGAYFAFGFWIAIPLIAVLATAAYYLYALQRGVFGPFNKKLANAHDLHLYEVIPVAVLLALIVALGIYPRLFLEMISDNANLVCEILTANTVPGGV